MSHITTEDIDAAIRAANNGARVNDLLLDLRLILTKDK